jgi:hypothetical protein
MNNRDHHHERADRAERHKEAVAWKLTARHVRPVLRVTLVRVAQKELDSDNLQGSLKWVRDAIAAAMRIDDNSPLIDWVYGQASAPPDFFEVRVAIDPIPPSDWSSPRPRSDLEQPVLGRAKPKSTRAKKAPPKKFTAEPKKSFAELATPAVYRPRGAR